MIDDKTPKCALCYKPLAGKEWIDDEEYGDVHVECLEEMDA